MKKRLISLVLSVSMLFALAAPAFADITDSSLLGSVDDVTKIVAKKTSYTLSSDATPIDIAADITAYIGNKNIADPHELTYTLTDKNNCFVSDDYGTVSAIDSPGTATLKVSTPSGRVSVTISLKTSSNSGGATSFAFEDTSFNLPVGNYSGTVNSGYSVHIMPSPSGTVFTSEQMAAIQTALNDGSCTFSDRNVDYSFFSPSEAEDGSYVSMNFSGPSLSGLSAGSTRNRISLIVKDFPVNGRDIKRTATASYKNTAFRPMSAFANKGTLSLKVGETKDLFNSIKYSSTATNVGKFTYALDYFGNADTYDYAALTGKNSDRIIGIAPGSLYVTATYEDGATTKFKVTVSAASVSSTTPVTGNVRLSTSVASGKIGSSFTLAVLNAPEGADIVYSSKNSDVALVTDDGKVVGMGIGSTQIVVSVDGEELYCNVTISNSAPNNNGGSTGVPQTGVVTLCPLF